MPYIKKEDRIKYDDLINDLAVTLRAETKDNDTLSGHLNYVFFRLAGLVAQGSLVISPSYARTAVVLSAMGESESEFRRRILVPYEDKKIKENGDVEL